MKRFYKRWLQIEWSWEKKKTWYRFGLFLFMMPCSFGEFHPTTLFQLWIGHRLCIEIRRDLIMVDFGHPFLFLWSFTNEQL